MVIDCETCSAQGVHCSDCVVTALLNAPPERFELDSDEQIAFVSLADAGLVPPLRLVPGGISGPEEDPGHRCRRGIA